MILLSGWKTAHGQIDSTSAAPRIADVVGTIEVGQMMVFEGKTVFGFDSHRVSLGFRYSREMRPIFIFLSDNHPKRILNEISLHYVLRVPWDGKIVQISGGPNYIYGSGRGSLLRSQERGQEPLYLGAQENFYQPRNVASFGVSGSLQILFLLSAFVDSGLSFYGNLNRHDSYWHTTLAVKIHFLESTILDE